MPITTFSLSLITEYTIHIIHLVLLFLLTHQLFTGQPGQICSLWCLLGFYCTTAIIDLSNLEIYNFNLNKIAIAIIRIYCLLFNPPLKYTNVVFIVDMPPVIFVLSVNFSDTSTAWSFIRRSRIFSFSNSEILPDFCLTDSER